MGGLVINAHAKINWSLDVIGLREDGYHQLDMLTQSLALCDQLTFASAEKLRLWVDGAPSDDEDNLVLRAARRMQREAGKEMGASIALTKNIPSRAGLGGGSADCAATLVALNRLWGLNLSGERLHDMGLMLGADVPFCLTGGLQRVGGVGDVLTPIPAPESPHLLIIQPDEGLSTAQVFMTYDHIFGERAHTLEAMVALAAGDYESLNRYAANSLMRAATSLSPAIMPAIEQLRLYGALFARMTGSGSVVFGVFGDRSGCLRAQRALSARFRCCIATKTWPCGVDICE